MNSKMVFAFQKVKSRMGIRALLAHNLRIDKPKNADRQREKLNVYHKNLGRDIGRTMLAYHKNLKGHQPRKNAVWAHEYVISASPEKMDTMTRKEQMEFFKDAAIFIAKKYGKESLVIPSVHFDEKTPHMHVIVQPMHKGKLNGKHFTGGSKHAMTALRKKFHKDVAQKYGLDYGVPRSPDNKPSHDDLQRHYDLVNKELPEAENQLKHAMLDLVTTQSEVDEANRKLDQVNRQMMELESERNVLSSSVSDLRNEIDELNTLSNNARQMTRQALTDAIEKLDRDETRRPAMRM